MEIRLQCQVQYQKCRYCVRGGTRPPYQNAKAIISKCQWHWRRTCSKCQASSMELSALWVRAGFYQAPSVLGFHRAISSYTGTFLEMDVKADERSAHHTKIYKGLYLGRGAGVVCCTTGQLALCIFFWWLSPAASKTQNKIRTELEFNNYSSF